MVGRVIVIFWKKCNKPLCIPGVPGVARWEGVSVASRPYWWRALSRARAYDRPTHHPPFCSRQRLVHASSARAASPRRRTAASGVTCSSTCRALAPRCGNCANPVTASPWSRASHCASTALSDSSNRYCWMLIIHRFTCLGLDVYCLSDRWIRSDDRFNLSLAIIASVKGWIGLIFLIQL